MAYDRTKLVHIGGVAPLPQVWQYFSSDTVTGAGYIPQEEGVRAGDQVEVIDITYSSGLVSSYESNKYVAVADANGVLTLYENPGAAVIGLDTEVKQIKAVIPTEASADNQLADKAFVATNYQPKA